MLLPGQRSSSSLAAAVASFALASSIHTPVVRAHESFLYASTVSYCSPPSAILIDTFEVAFFKANHSVVFNIIAESTRELNVTARAVVNAYALTPVDLSFDFCDLTSLLCPIPAYTFNGTATIPVSTSIASRLPSIGYIIPNLEAYVQLTLFDSHTKEVVGCIQVTASNGLTTRLTSVQWTIGGLAVGAAFFVIVVTLGAALLSRRKRAEVEGGAFVDEKKLGASPTPMSPVDGDGTSMIEEEDPTRVASPVASTDGLSAYPPLPPPPSSSGHSSTTHQPAFAHHKPTPSSASTLVALRPLSPPQTLLAEPLSIPSSSSSTPHKPAKLHPTTIAPASTWHPLPGFHPRRLQHILIEYILFIQHIVLTGILHLNYPIAYTAFVQNFFWAFGIFGFRTPELGVPVSFDTQGLSKQKNDVGTQDGTHGHGVLAGSGVQDAIDRLRSMTGAGSYESVVDGSDMSDVGKWRAVDPMLYGQRALSPYNAIASSSQAGSASDHGSSVGDLFPVLGGGSGGLIARRDWDEDVTEFARELGAFLSPSVRSSRRSEVPHPAVLSLSKTQTPYITTSQMIEPGLPNYANALGVPTANTGMTVWFSAAILFAGALFLVLLGRLIGAAIARFTHGNRRSRSIFPASAPDAEWDWKERYWAGVRSIGGEVLLPMLVLPVSTVTFYQWTIRNDAWLPDFLTALLVVALWASLLGLLVRSIVLRRQRRRSALDAGAIAAELDPELRDQGKRSWYHYFLPTSPISCIIIPSLLLKSLFASFAHHSGLVQVIAMLVIELLVLSCLVAYTVLSRRHRRILTPTPPTSPSAPQRRSSNRSCLRRTFSAIFYCCRRRSRQRSGDPPRTDESHALMITLSLFRLASFGILVAFTEQLTVKEQPSIKPIPRVVVGIVEIVVLSVGILLVVFVGLWEIGKCLRDCGRWWIRRRRIGDGQRTDEAKGKEVPEKVVGVDEVA